MLRLRTTFAHSVLKSVLKTPNLPRIVEETEIAFRRPRYLASRRSTVGMQSSIGRDAQAIPARADAILRFWLGDGYKTAPVNSSAADKRDIWFRGGPEVDKLIVSKFEEDLKQAEAGELDEWHQGYPGLAAVILMDQLSRNIYRNSAKMFALDEKARNLSKQIHDEGTTSRFPLVHQVWLYLPLMHSEDLQDLELCVKRIETLLEEAQQLPDASDVAMMLQNNREFAIKHKVVVERWGRYPHRNAILGRENTPEEERGLVSGDIPSF